MKPFGITSDTHAHNWSAFSETRPSGVNSRLQIILDELERVAKMVAETGGDTLYHGGDLFHVRGAVVPSVINPTKERFAHIKKTYGVNTVINGGNHDMEGKNSTRLGNAVAALDCDWIEPISEPEMCGEGGEMMVIPWHDSVVDLKKTLEYWAKKCEGPLTNLLIHAPVDGVIPGLPNHGLTQPYLKSLGFKRVFAGHYHNYKDLGDGVYSIGASTHQTWSDVGSRAGFLIVYENGVHFHASHAPSFVDLGDSTDTVEMLERCDGNYVRAKVTTSKIAEIDALRKLILDNGAKGVTLTVVKESARTRTTSASVRAGASLEASIGDFIKGFADAGAQAEILNRSLKTLSEAT